MPLFSICVLSLFMQKPFGFIYFSFFLEGFNQCVYERERVAGSFLNFETTHTRERFCTLEMKTFRVLPYLKGEKMMTLLALPLWHVGGFRYFGWCNYGGVPEKDFLYERRASLVCKVEVKGYDFKDGNVICCRFNSFRGITSILDS